MWMSSTSGRSSSCCSRPNPQIVFSTAPPLLRMADGSVRHAPEPVADSDADLIAQLQYVAAHHGGAERAFSPAQPCLNMQLPDGSRLAAMREVVPHPTVTIRRHRLVDVRLADLQALGSLSPAMVLFLTWLVHAKRSILVTGMPVCGKTTLLRALAREIPDGEHVRQRAQETPATRPRTRRRRGEGHGRGSDALSRRKAPDPSWCRRPWCIPPPPASRAHPRPPPRSRGWWARLAYPRSCQAPGAAAAAAPVPSTG